MAFEDEQSGHSLSILKPLSALHFRPVRRSRATVVVSAGFKGAAGGPTPPARCRAPHVEGAPKYGCPGFPGRTACECQAMDVSKQTAQTGFPKPNLLTTPTDKGPCSTRSTNLRYAAGLDLDFGGSYSLNPSIHEKIKKGAWSATHSFKTSTIISPVWHLNRRCLDAEAVKGFRSATWLQ